MKEKTNEYYGVSISIDKKILKKMKEIFINKDQKYNLDRSYEKTDSKATEKNVAILEEIKKMVSLKLVEPIDEPTIEMASINRKGCKLTRMGKKYWCIEKAL